MTDSENALTHELLERSLVVRHQVVDRDPPVAQADKVRLEEGDVEEQLHAILLPRAPRVLSSEVTGCVSEHSSKTDVCRAV